MDQVQQVKDKIDIVSFISEYVPLKKAGSNFKANCPFHNEKSPSFFVSPDRQTWHCFGSCSKGGDIYTFLMDYEKIEFYEALRMLAKRAGIELVSQSSPAAHAAASKKERLYQINSLAKEYYHYLLTKHEVGKKALEYLEKRGINQKLIETFMLGFAPNTNNSLVKYLIEKKRYSKDDLLEGGLAFVGRSGLVDFFRGRLMFPLIDHRDNVVGFSGRVLDGNVPSKYINTKETPVYHKGDHVFGLNVTKEAIRREKQVILVEGEVDVLSCFEHGIGNVVAVKGTALTESQVTLLARYAQKITFCFDGDKAGQEAIKRSLVVVEKKGLTPTVIVIPQGKDPDEALKTEPGKFKKAASEDMGVYDYLLTKLVAGNDLKSAEGKRIVVDEFLSFIGLIQNEIVKEHFLRRLSSEVGTSYESILKELQRLSRNQAVVQLPVASPKKKRPRDEMLEEYVLALVMQAENPKPLLEKTLELLADSVSSESASQKLLARLRAYCEKNDLFDKKRFANSLPKELLDTYDIALLSPIPEFENQEKLLAEVVKSASLLRRYSIQKRMKELGEEIAEREQAGKAVDDLQGQYNLLVSQLEKQN